MPQLALEQAGSRAVIPLGGLSAPRQPHDGHWLVAGSWLVNREDAERVRRTWLERERMSEALGHAAFENSWWIFRADGTLVGESDTEQGRVSRFGRLARVDREGRILTIMQDPYPHVARWVLQWGNPGGGPP